MKPSSGRPLNVHSDGDEARLKVHLGVPIGTQWTNGRTFTDLRRETSRSTPPEWTPKRRITDKGYEEIYLPGHPLAFTARSNQGWVRFHRVILYHQLGEGLHPCHWCGWELPWLSHDERSYKRCINVDHLDGDRLNNDPANLVPSCWYCNANRGWSELAPTVWATFLAEVCHGDPNERPSVLLWLAERLEAKS